MNDDIDGRNSSEERADRDGLSEDKFYKFARGEGVMNLPNKLTVSRVVMIPVFVLFFYLEFTGHFFFFFSVFIAASLTVLLDGKIARRYKLVTNLGKFLDPIADKVLVATAFIVMLTAPWMFTLFAGGWAIVLAGCGVAVILAREIIISGFRMVAADAGKVIAADKFGKYKTVFQDASAIVLLLSAGVTEIVDLSSGAAYTAAQVVNYAGLALFVVAVVLTVLSGVNYIVKNIEVLKK